MPWKKREWMVSSQAIPPNWERTVSSSLTLPPVSNPCNLPISYFVEVGGLMAYCFDSIDLMRRVANMTAEVSKVAKPSDIPFYQETKYELVLNQKAARSLGLEFPPALLMTADEG